MAMSSVADRDAFRSLRRAAPLRLREAACLTLRSAYGECRRCEQACPVRALKVASGALSLEEGCLGCGRCVAACPTGALEVPGSCLPHPAPSGDGPLAVECGRVPEEALSPNAIRVPCAGGLSLGRLLALVADAGNRALVVLDRGWCEHCPAGGDGRHPAADVVETAAGILEAMGLPAAQVPRIELGVLAPRFRPTGGGRVAAETVARERRRAFCGDALGYALAAMSAGAKPADRDSSGAGRPADRSAPMRSPERDRVLGALRTIAARSGRALPSFLFPAVEIDPERCQGHRVCASVCPTGALRLYTRHGRTGVMFSAQACITCGDCVRACPERALRLLPLADGATDAAPRALTSFKPAACRECGDMFAAANGETLCPACCKTRNFARAGRDLFTGRG